MRDLMELTSEIAEKATSVRKRKEMFAEEFLKELAQEKGADIAPHLSCVFDVIKQEYEVTLSIPLGSDKFYSGSRNVK